MRALICSAALFAATAMAAEPIRLTVDLRDAPRQVYHARETIPVAPGVVGLRYAKWIPGEHMPSGPITDLVGLRITASDTPLSWQRDPEDMYLLRVDVPEHVDRIDVALDYLTPTVPGLSGNSSAATTQLAMLAWNTVALYPDGEKASEIRFEPIIELPAGWEPATSLRTSDRNGSRVTYDVVSLETLIDSPVISGAHHRSLLLPAPAGLPNHTVQLVADSDAAIGTDLPVYKAFDHIVPEAFAIFGAHHYRDYVFLVGLSDHFTPSGLEHHESSDNRLTERELIEKDLRSRYGDVFAHEYVHSWNAKYKRPAGLATMDYQRPMVGDLIWVYEGLTQYLGQVLATRSGFWSDEQAREQFAQQAASLAYTPGRQWRTLLDTSRSAQLLYPARTDGSAWRRSYDFYSEGAMLWLEVDALIRQGSKGRRSIDDFCKAFFGPPTSPPQVIPFTRAELVDALNSVTPLDWETFFHERVDTLQAAPPTRGIEAAGWKLVYDDKPNSILESLASDPASIGIDLRYSLGIRLSQHGQIIDVVQGQAAAVAGVSVGSEIVAVNSRAYSRERLTDAIEYAARARVPIELLVKNADQYSTFRLDYHDGERYPHLARDATKPDLLSKILAPRTWKPEST